MKEKVTLTNAASTVFAPQLVGLVTTMDHAGRPNVATFAWVMSTSHDPELIAVSVAEARYTYECLTDEFVVNLPTKDLAERVWTVGTLSGRETDKFRVAGLTPIPAIVVQPPRIAECVTHVECLIVDKVRTGDHTIFIGRVVAKSGDVDALKDGILNERVEPLFHLGALRSSLAGNALLLPSEISARIVRSKQHYRCGNVCSPAMLSLYLPNLRNPPPYQLLARLGRPCLR
ncbi:MAG: flavin reductase family protein [Halobacteriota archaeon]